MRFETTFYLAALALGGMTSIACGGTGTEPSGTGGTGGTTSSTSTDSGGQSTGTGGSATGGNGTGGAGGATTGGAGGATGGVGGATGGASTGGAGGTTTTFTNTCDPLAPVSYDACTGNTFFPDGSCQDGSCAAVDLEKRVFAEWKKQVKALSGFSDADFDSRVRVSAISHSPGPADVNVRIDYVVVVDWMRSRQNEGALFGNMPLVNPPTDQQITSSVAFAIEDAMWTTLGGIDHVVSEEAMQAGFAQCRCGFVLDPCHFSFQNVTGELVARGNAVIDAAANECKRGRVDLSDGALVECLDEPCAIN